MIVNRRLLAVVAVAASACAGGANPRQFRPDPPAKPAAPAPDVPAPRDDGRLPPGVRPTRESVELTIDPRQPTFFGRARIKVVVEQPTRVIVLHAKGPRIMTAAISSHDGKQWAHASTRMAAHGKNEPEELVLSVDQPLPVGSAEIDLQYEAPFGENLDGLYRVEEKGKWYAFTQFEPNDARRAFPCFDEPGFKIPFLLSITVPAEDLALANMPEGKKRENLATGLVSYEFPESPPLPSYLVAFAVGPLELTPGANDPTPIRLVSLPGKGKLGKLALETGRDVVEALGRYFDIPYPYPKLDLCAVPNFGAGAMENPGLVTFREELVLLDDAHASTDARRDLAGVMAHELGHQWFGDLVTTAWWDDLWLNEGFATWITQKILRSYRPSWGVELEATRDKEWAMGLDSLASARRIREPVKSSSEALEAFDGITYDKGASVLSMIERWVGPVAFRKGLREYLEAHRFGNATAADLFAALSHASGREVAPVMSSFVDQAGVPLVDIGFSCRKNAQKKLELSLQLRQREYRPLGVGERAKKLWNVPVCVRFVDRPGHVASECALLDGSERSLVADVDTCPKTVVPNDDEDGYYRWSLPPAALVALAEPAPVSLSDREIVGIVGNGWALVKSGDLAPGAYLDLLGRLGHSKRHAVWEEIVATLRELERALVTDAELPNFHARVAKLLVPALERVGYEPRSGDDEETRLLQKTLLAAAVDLADDARATKTLHAIAEKWLTDPSGTDDDLAEIALPVLARKGDAALFERLRERMQSARVPEERLIALGGLTGFDDPALVERALGLTLDAGFRAQDVRYVFRPLFERRATVKLAYAWIRAHFDALKSRLPTFVVGRFPSIAAYLCDDQAAAEVDGFFRPRLEKIEGADKHLDQAVEASKLCAALRAGQARAAAEAFGGSP